MRENNSYFYYNTGGISRIVDENGNDVLSSYYDRIGDQLLASSHGFYYLVNIKGDVICIINDSGEVIEYNVYEPFGGQRASQRDISIRSDFRYSGAIRSKSGKYILGSRLYDPAMGRWLSADVYRGRIDDPLSLNRYAYVMGIPSIS